MIDFLRVKTKFSIFWVARKHFYIVKFFIFDYFDKYKLIMMDARVCLQFFHVQRI